MAFILYTKENGIKFFEHGDVKPKIEPHKNSFKQIKYNFSDVIMIEVTTDKTKQFLFNYFKNLPFTFGSNESKLIYRNDLAQFIYDNLPNND